MTITAATIEQIVINPNPIPIPMMVAFPSPELSAVAEGALEGMVDDGSSAVVGVGVMGGPVVREVDVGAKRYPLIWTAHT
jgi:hypothetical protein